MNTINSTATMPMDGQYMAQNTGATNPVMKKVELPNNKLSPTSKDVVDNISRDIEQVKKDALQLQKLSDIIMDRKLQFNVNEELGSVVIKIVDPKTDKIIKEIPSEDMQKLKINLRRVMGILFDEVI